MKSFALSIRYRHQSSKRGIPCSRRSGTSLLMGRGYGQPHHPSGSGRSDSGIHYYTICSADLGASSSTYKAYKLRETERFDGSIPQSPSTHRFTTPSKASSSSRHYRSTISPPLPSTNNTPPAPPLTITHKPKLTPRLPLPQPRSMSHHF
jgi:hypothetical protein